MATKVTKTINYQYEDGLTFIVTLDGDEPDEVRLAHSILKAQSVLRIAEELRGLYSGHRSVCPEHGFYEGGNGRPWRCGKCISAEAKAPGENVDDNLIQLLTASVEMAGGKV